MKRLFFVIILLIYSTFLYADVIHLKNGHSFEGEIIKETDETLTIKEGLGKEGFVISDFKKSEIERIEKGVYLKKKEEDTRADKKKAIKHYTGKTNKDKQIAKELYERAKECGYGVLWVEVDDFVAGIHINETLYRQMLADKVSGKLIVANWVRLLCKNYNSRGAVLIYYSGLQVIVGGYSDEIGELRVIYEE